MNRLLIIISVLFFALTTSAQTDVSAVYGTYDGNLYTEIGKPATTTGTPKKVKIEVAKGTKENTVNLTIQNFVYGILQFKDITLDNVGVTLSNDGCTFAKVTEKEVEVETKNGLSLYLFISLDDTKSYVKNGKMWLDMKIRYTTTYIYSIFNGNKVVTGIDLPVASEQTKDMKYYDLSGRRVVKPHKGIYIVNGKKIIIR